MSYKKDNEKKYIKLTNKMLSLLPDFVKSYIISIEFTTTALTRYEYVKDISCFFDYISDTKCISKVILSSLNSLTKQDFENYFHHLQNYEKNNHFYSNSPVSIKRKLSAIKGFMTYLFEENLIETNVITKVKIPKIRKKEIIYLDNEETEKFLSTVESGGTLTPKQQQYHKIQSTRDLAICYLLLSTGIRISECVGIDMKDIDFTTSSVHIIRKGGKEDTVYFSDEASAFLVEYYEQRRNIETKEGHETAFFLSSHKSRITDRSIENIVKKYAERSVPLKHITPHKLRSSFATRLYSETNDIYLVAEDLGHSNLHSVKKYAQIAEKRKEQNRNVIKLRNE